MLDSIGKLVGSLEKLFAILQLKKVLLLILLLVSLGLAYALYENRNTGYGLVIGRFTDAPIPSTVSDETQLTLRSVADRYDNIVAVEVIQATLRLNARQGVFFYSDEKPLLLAYQAFQKNKVALTPLFITGDLETNDRLTAIIEQEMPCVVLPQSTIRQIPISTAYAKAICSLSIPPDFGKMAGWINIWLKEPIDKSQYNEYKQLLRSMSKEIYDREVTGSIR